MKLRLTAVLVEPFHTLINGRRSTDHSSCSEIMRDQNSFNWVLPPLLHHVTGFWVYRWMKNAEYSCFILMLLDQNIYMQCWFVGYPFFMSYDKLWHGLKMDILVKRALFAFSDVLRCIRPWCQLDFKCAGSQWNSCGSTCDNHMNTTWILNNLQVILNTDLIKTNITIFHLCDQGSCVSRSKCVLDRNCRRTCKNHKTAAVRKKETHPLNSWGGGNEKMQACHWYIVCVCR